MTDRDEANFALFYFEQCRDKDAERRVQAIIGDQLTPYELKCVERARNCRTRRAKVKALRQLLAGETEHKDTQA